MHGGSHEMLLKILVLLMALQGKLTVTCNKQVIVSSINITKHKINIVQHIYLESYYLYEFEKVQANMCIDYQSVYRLSLCIDCILCIGYYIVYMSLYIVWVVMLCMACHIVIIMDLIITLIEYEKWGH